MADYILALTNARLNVQKHFFARKDEACREARAAIERGDAIAATVFRDYGFLGAQPIYRITKGKKQGRQPE